MSGSENGMTSEPTGTEPLAVRIPEACRLTGLGRSKLYELIADGTIEIVKVGAVTLVPFATLRRLIANAPKERPL